MSRLGEWLKKRRRSRGWAQVDLAKAADVTIDTISRAERGKTVPELRTLRKIAASLEAPFSEVQLLVEGAADAAAIRATQGSSGEPESATTISKRKGSRVDLKETVRDKPGADFDANVEPYSEVAVPEIPLFEASLAAGSWTDVSEIGEVCDPRQIDHGLFRVRLAGDSMKPRYPDGAIVEFMCIRFDRDRLEVGKNYYVQRDDGTATFKQLLKIEQDDFDAPILVLGALNKKKYPTPLRVNQLLVVRMAVAKGTFLPD